MTSNYDDFTEYPQYNNLQSDLEEDGYFELLSAYIDGEATTAERKQVQQWLDNDPEIKQTYLQLLKLQGEMQNLTPPTTAISADTLAEKVFNTIDRRNSRKRVAIWGSAIAATIIGTVVSIVPNSPFSSLRVADNNINQPTMIAVSLNKPAVIIPKAAVSTPNYRDEI
jgi:anti-sigma factor RsiW